MTAIGIAVGCAAIWTSPSVINGLRRIYPRVVLDAREQKSSNVIKNGLIKSMPICNATRSLESMTARRLRDHRSSSHTGSKTLDDSLSGLPVSLEYLFRVASRSEILSTESHSALRDF